MIAKWISHIIIAEPESAAASGYAYQTRRKYSEKRNIFTQFRIKWLSAERAHGGGLALCVQSQPHTQTKPTKHTIGSLLIGFKVMTQSFSYVNIYYDF